MALDMLVDGVGRLVIEGSNAVRKLQSGHVGYYIFFMVGGMIAFLAFTLRGFLF
jgi:NADH-quinone oxidoreductase subunit L